MEGSQQQKGAPAGRDRDLHAAEELAVEAERRLAQLMEQAEGQGGAPADAEPDVKDWSDAPPPTGRRVRAFDQGEEADLPKAAMAATERLADRVDTLSAELVALGRAMSQALDATNERLAALERQLRTGSTPPATADERAAARLRQKLRQAAEGPPRPSGSARRVRPPPPA